ARANVVRAALLAAEGGVYLDTDTVTVAPLDPLRAEASFFCGLERLVFPGELKRSRSPARWGAALARTALRDLCRRAPDGWRHFRRVERHYPTAANNAVLGAEPGHPLLLELLERMAATPPARQTVRFALGTHLLQAVLRDASGDAARGLRVYEPPAFYPLGPEISEHWFRFTDRPRLAEVLLPDTRVVHWYASVRTAGVVDRIDPAYVRANAGRQLFSALARPFLAPAWLRRPARPAPQREPAGAASGTKSSSSIDTCPGTRKSNAFIFRPSPAISEIRCAIGPAFTTRSEKMTTTRARPSRKGMW
ncbi:MAG TPA: glycosyltransferase, partial [Polyangiaceae bacterium]|nr:glycosyltransferase [Polyangiaceae bacterium]